MSMHPVEGLESSCVDGCPACRVLAKLNADPDWGYVKLLSDYGLVDFPWPPSAQEEALDMMDELREMLGPVDWAEFDVSQLHMKECRRRRCRRVARTAARSF